ALSAPALESREIRRALPGWIILVSSGLMGVVPDLDTFAMRALGMPSGGFWGHRGFFHSAFFLTLFATALAAIFARSASLWTAIMWAGSAITHPLLDMLTDGGSGVMLLFPFTDARLFFPWRPIHVSPLEISRFFSRAGYILRSEAPFCLAAVALGYAG